MEVALAGPYTTVAKKKIVKLNKAFLESYQQIAIVKVNLKKLRHNMVY